MAGVKAAVILWTSYIKRELIDARIKPVKDFFDKTGGSFREWHRCFCVGDRIDL